jgi:hypothetical protein
MHKFSPKRRNADTHPALVWNRSLFNMVPTQHPFEVGHWKRWYPPNTRLHLVIEKDDIHPRPVWIWSLKKMISTQHPFEFGHWQIWYPPNTTWDCNWTLWKARPTPTMVWTVSEKAPQAIPSHVWTILLCWSSRTASWLCMGMLTISSKPVLNCLTACNKSHWL